MGRHACVHQRAHCLAVHTSGSDMYRLAAALYRRLVAVYCCEGLNALPYIPDTWPPPQLTPTGEEVVQVPGVEQLPAGRGQGGVPGGMRDGCRCQVLPTCICRLFGVWHEAPAAGGRAAHQKC